jgi:hypothetical protein
MIFEHPQKVCMTYVEHFKLSSEMAYVLGFGSIKAIIHAIYPDAFVTSTTDIINYIQKRLSESGCHK